MSLSIRELAIAGFAWNSGKDGLSQDASMALLEKTEAAGIFNPDVIAKAIGPALYDLTHGEEK